MKSLKIAKLLNCYIARSRKNNLKAQKGFTLIEFLVVIAILGAIGSIIFGIVTFSLRGTNKTNTIETLRQSGNYTISQMAKTIEYAETFEGLSMDGVNYDKTCPLTEPTPTPSTKDDYTYIKIKPFSGDSSIEYFCENTGVMTLNSKVDTVVTKLIDTSPGSKIKISSCAFSCTVTGALEVPVIGIRFVLEPNVSSTLVEKFTPPIIFETSVTMRNYQK